MHEKIADAYVKRLSERANALPVGDPFTTQAALGPIINDQQLGRVTDILARSTAAGARVAAGGTHEGRFFRPTVLTGVTPSTPAFSEEIFGPIAPVTTFASDDEAVALANQTEYGLAAAIYSRDIARAERLAARLRTGLVHINDQTVNDDARALRRIRCLRQWRPLRQPLKLGRVHNVALDDDSDRRPPVPVLSARSSNTSSPHFKGGPRVASRSPTTKRQK